jgi:hypothetical protein
MNNEQFMQAQTQLLIDQVGLAQQMSEVVGGPNQMPGNVGSMNLGGAQLPRIGEAATQQQNAINQVNPAVYPQGMTGIDRLGAQLGGPTGGPVNVPSGQRLGG